jgi:hypothetical protein
VRWEKASVAIERNETIGLGMEWSNIRLLLLGLNFAEIANLAKLHLCNGK